MGMFIEKRPEKDDDDEIVTDGTSLCAVRNVHSFLRSMGEWLMVALPPYTRCGKRDEGENGKKKYVHRGK